jgi:16S rRNA (cytosine1402-N4)-methyltransferase
LESKNINNGYKHIPVLADEIVEYLNPGCGAFRFIDGTLGRGGHSSLLLKLNTEAELLGIDRDGEALKGVENILDFASNRIHLVKGEFGSMADYAISLGWHLVDAVLLDLGVSSPQIDSPIRGFSFRTDGPLDMRMDTRSGKTAARVLNNTSQEKLAEIFWKYGDIRESRKLARAIIARREIKPWSHTLELAELCENVLKSGKRKSVPPATLCFQALRIYVNDELDELEKGLSGAMKVLKPGGRIAVISFHSLEDRIVKNFFRQEAAECLCPPGLPACVCNHKPTLKILTKKPIIAQKSEIDKNRRSASAKLRVAELI